MNLFMPQNNAEQNLLAVVSFITGLTGIAADLFSFMNFGMLQISAAFVLIIGFLFAASGVFTGIGAVLQLIRAGSGGDMRRLAFIGLSAGLLSAVISAVAAVALIAALPSALQK